MMSSKGRNQKSEWDSHDDYNDSMYDPQYQDENVSGTTTLDHCRLYITNIPKGLNEEGLKAAFSKFGTLLEVHLSKDPLKKYGLVKYETPGEAKLAMMKMNRTEPLKLNINVAHKGAKKSDDKKKGNTNQDRGNTFQDRGNTFQDRGNNSARERNSNRDRTASVTSKGRASRGHDTGTSETMHDESILEDTQDFGFPEMLDPNVTLELESIKLEQLKLKEEQLLCKHRMIMLKQQERRPLHQNTTSNRCVLPDGKIVVRHSDRSADLDVSHSAGAGDSSGPGLQRNPSRDCVSCGAPADSFCARCEVTPYCSPRCQARDWTTRHRAVCHNLARLAAETEALSPVVKLNTKICNPVPLRRPRAVAETREGPRKFDDDAATRVSDRSERSTAFFRLQTRAKPQNNKGNNEQTSPRRQINKNASPRMFKPKPTQNTNPPAPENIPKTKLEPEIKKEIKIEAIIEKPPAPKMTQVNGAVKQENSIVKQVKAASTNEATPATTLIPKNYLIELLSVGDIVLLSVDSKASECRTTKGDYVCLSMHEKFETNYQLLCEDYFVDCDADAEPFKTCPGDACSYFNESDSSWYRARCLNANTLALLDSSRLVTISPSDKLRRLQHKYQALPEFCCLLESKHVEIGSNLKCCIMSKSGGGYKVEISDVDTGSLIGEGIVSRWIPTVDYPTIKPVIPEVARPALSHNSVVLLVEVAALDRAFVRSAAPAAQRDYESVLQNALLAGIKGTPLKEPPTKGQTVIAKFSDGLHYRALCKRTNVAQNKYQLEYAEFGNVEICRNLEDLYPCPPHLDLSAAPTQVSMVKLCAEGGELTPPALEFVETLKDSVSDEMILTLPNGEASAPSGAEVTLKLMKNNENVNKKIIEMCTPDWKKLQQNGGDVVQVAALMYEDLEYRELPPGPLTLDVLDISVLEGGVLSGCLQGDKHADYVFNQLTQKMAEYCNSELGKEPYLPKIEELCIAKCPPYPQWFRAVLVEQEGGAGGARGRVCYVDYGNMELVDVSLLRKMLPEFVRDVPVLAAHFEIIDFPKNPTPDMLARAAEFMKMDDEGRGVLSVTRCVKQDEGWYHIEAPDLINAMKLRKKT